MWVSLLAFIALLIATSLLASHRYVWDALLLLGLATSSLAWRLARVAAFEKGQLLHTVRIVPRTFAAWGRVGCLFVAAAVALAARRHTGPHDYTALFLWWLLAVACFATTLLVPLLPRARAAAGDFLTLERYGLAALLLVAFVVRAAALGRVPVNLSGDEGTFLLAGLRLIERPLANPFATGWLSHPTLSFLVYAVGMRLFGATVAGARMLSAGLGTLTVLTTFLLARHLGGRRTGWLAALLLTFSHYHIHYSRIALNNILDPLIGTLALWLVWVAMQPGRRSSSENQFQVAGCRLQVQTLATFAPWRLNFYSRWCGIPHGDFSSNGQWQIANGKSQMANGVWCVGGSPALHREHVCLWGLAGLVAGVGWYGYFGARWVTMLLGLIVVWRMLVEPRFLARHWQGLALFAGAWLVVVLPLLGWYTVHPSSLTERYNAVSIFASGWLEREVVITGKSAFALILQQLWKSATAFHLTFDPTFWYFPQRPLVDFITGTLMIVGTVAALLRVRWPSRALTLLWFGSTLVVSWVLTENPPSSQRGLLLMPAVALLAAWGVEALDSFVRSPRATPARDDSRRVGEPVGAATMLSGALLVALVAFNLGFYFQVYTPRRIYGNPTAEIATTYAQFALAHPHPACVTPPYACERVDAQPPVYFFGPPALYWQFGAIAFLLRDQTGIDVMPGEIPAAISGPARFVFVGERLAELERVQAAYPGGGTTEVTAPDGRVLAVVYDW